MGSGDKSSSSHFSDPITRIIFPPVEAALERTAEKEQVWEMLCAGEKKMNIPIFILHFVCKGGRGGAICLEAGFHNWKYLIK